MTDTQTPVMRHTIGESFKIVDAPFPYRSQPTWTNGDVLTVVGFDRCDPLNGRKWGYLVTSAEHGTIGPALPNKFFENYCRPVA